MEKKLDNSISRANNHEEEDIKKTLKDDEFKSAIEEVNEIKLENARLKLLLQQIENDYTSLQTRYFNICQPDLKKSGSPTCTHENIADEEESELVSLRLGRSPSPSESKKVDKKRSYDKTIEDYPSCNDQSNDGLKLGLDYSTRISESDFIKPSNDPTPGPTSEVVKTVKRCDDESVKKDAGDDEISQPNVKRARVSVRTKCDYPTINDGCQWRKYGQKISRGNPCPRSYYRCSVAPLCPVRKQVQRCLEDMSILITTYEGTHNHSLPIEATAMASTTSAAASMLLSGSSTSSQISKNFPNLPNISKTTPLYLSNSSSNPLPTITLDFTTFPTTSSFTSFNFPSNFQPGSGFLSNSLSFSSPESTIMPKILGSGGLNYDSTSTLPYHNNLINIGSSQKQFDNSSNKLKEDSSQQALTETLTKAITSDPSFQSVLAAAISSMVGATKT
ncbi:probable WRKY transcription factor 72 [Solanum verrucosum]|uniref:probable WRKY transcription factor 72 n=1 Tax=Solanum verrucosum TaxID=315347 RepID=UPI0020D0A0C3|nr:probable WRKY transcription factor 72 [Solanum verrucosum]